MSIKIYNAFLNCFKSTYSTIYCIIITTNLLFLSGICGCGDNPAPFTPVYDPEVTANISGASNIDYEGQTTVTQSEDSTGRIIIRTGGTITLNKQIYGMSMTFFYKDTVKTGQLVFVNSSFGISGDFAVASFEVGDGKDRRIFISSEGIVNITEILGNRIKGNFYFTAFENDSSLVHASNGKLNIFN